MMCGGVLFGWVGHGCCLAEWAWGAVRLSEGMTTKKKNRDRDKDRGN